MKSSLNQTFLLFTPHTSLKKRISPISFLGMLELSPSKLSILQLKNLKKVLRQNVEAKNKPIGIF